MAILRNNIITYTKWDGHKTKYYDYNDKDYIYIMLPKCTSNVDVAK